MLNYILGCFPKQKVNFTCITVAANTADKPEERGGWVYRRFLFLWRRWFDVTNAENKVANEMVKTYRKLVKLNDEFDQAQAQRKSIVGQAMSNSSTPIGRSLPYMLEGKTWPLTHTVEPKPPEKEFKAIREMLNRGPRKKSGLEVKLDLLNKGNKTSGKFSETLADPKTAELIQHLSGERVTPVDIANQTRQNNQQQGNNQQSHQNNGGGNKQRNSDGLPDYREPN